MDSELIWGYTLDDLDHMARTALMANRSMAANWGDRYEAAYFAVVEALYSAEHWPHRGDLVRIGIKAISDMVRKELQHHGINRQDMDALAEGRKHKSFYMFWDGHLHSPSPEDYVVERMALWQIWPELTLTQQQILATRAAYGSNDLAASALGKRRHSFVTQLNQGRRRFRDLWHEGETGKAWANDQFAPTEGTGTGPQRAMAYIRRRRREPSTTVSRKTERCKRGHLRDETTTIYRRDGSRTCRICWNESPSRRRAAAKRRGGTPNA